MEINLIPAFAGSNPAGAATKNIERELIMAERALAHVEKIAWIRPIDGADNIELVGILGWKCIAKKGEFNVDDKCVYIEIDSLVNKDDERFEFLESKKYKVKTMKLGKFNCISQGLALPLTLFPEISNKNIGDNVTKELKITYYSADDIARKSSGDPNAKYKSMSQRHKNLFKKKSIRWLMRREWGRKLLFFFFGKKKDKPKDFPSWIVKTDETRIENAPFYLESTDKWVKSEKIDGTSSTYFVDYTKKKKGEFGVCSRNVRQQDEKQECYHTCGNVYWEMVGKYNIEKSLRAIAKDNNIKRIVLQGETFGESLQGNPYKLKGRDFRAFNLIFDGIRLGSIEAKNILEKYNIPFVPIISEEYEIPHTIEEMKAEADGYSVINPDVKREGFVYRSQDGSKSFKNVSVEYLLKHNG